MKHYYGGVAARNATVDALFTIVATAQWLDSKGLRLRSGRGKNGDEAFEMGSGGRAQIFLPRPDFRSHVDLHAEEEFPFPSPEAYEIAARHHPAWHRCGEYGRDLLARTSHVILGPRLDNPVDFVVCWTLGGGGTSQAVRVAQANDIRIFNLAIDRHEDELRDYVERRYP